MLAPALEQYDVVVLGGGPAGAATALTAAGAGAQVLVVERTHYEATRIGETLPPAIQTVLSDLKLWERFSSSIQRVPSFGIRSIWGSQTAHERSFLFDPHGTGWHVDRRAFDDSLADSAEERGVRWVRGGRFIACQQHPSRRAWSVVVASSGGLLQVRAGCLVDATGRSSVLARRLGARQLVIDRLLASFGFFRRSPSLDCESFTLVEAVEVGWWYSAPLPEDRLIVVLMTDADICAQEGLWKVSRWRRELERTAHTSARVRGCSLAGPIRVVPAQSYLMEPLCGPGWLAVGDAAIAIDPLAGQGVHKALNAGIVAGRMVREDNVWALPTFASYAARARQEFNEYLRLRRQYYGREQRWPNRRFWSRRIEKTIADEEPKEIPR